MKTKKSSKAAINPTEVNIGDSVKKEATVGAVLEHLGMQKEMSRGQKIERI